MEGEQIGPGMGLGSLRKPTASRASAVLQMRGPAEPLSLMGYGGDNHDQERSFTQLLSGAMASPNSDGRDDGGNSGHRTLGSGGGSFAARFAARTFSQKDMDMGGGGGMGYSGPASDQPKVLPPSRISISESYQLTIPPGLSPTQLLESPVFLSNAQQAEPSPTTGNFNLPPYVGEASNDRGNDEGSTPGFVFRPFPKAAAPRNSLSPLAGMVQQSYGQSQQPFSYPHAQGQSGGQQLSTSMMSSAVSLSGQGPGPTMSSGPPVAVALAMPPMVSGRQQPEPVRDRSPEQELHLPVSVPFIERPSEDGYNWRKYGQKQVKGSEYPRSYYKCTHAGCPMKKKVERSHDGQVTEIVYKGEHNHPKPQPTRRLAVAQVAAAHHLSDNAGDRTDGDGKEWGGFQTGAGDSGYYGANGGGDDPSSSVRRPFGLSLGPNGTPEPSSPSTSEDGSKSVTEDGDDDEPDSKRRKKEKKMIKELPPAPRTIREPRVVVQTTSDVDILDDGYRWRKYGQKVVKGNPHPRSYYKCTQMNCPVRKHVERASNDPKAVITTYEGKHNHDVPVARNSSHDTAALGPGTAPPPSQSGASLMPQSQPQDLYGKRLSVFGRLLEDGSSKGENGVSDTHLGVGVGMGSMDDSSSHNHLGKAEHQNSNMPVNYQASLQGRSMMDSYGGGSGVQELGLRPKQEQDDPNSHNSLEMNPFHAQRLAVLRH